MFNKKWLDDWDRRAEVFHDQTMKEIVSVVRFYESFMRRCSDVKWEEWECGHGVPLTHRCVDCGAGPILPVPAGYEVPSAKC